MVAFREAANSPGAYGFDDGSHGGYAQHYQTLDSEDNQNYRVAWLGLRVGGGATVEAYALAGDLAEGEIDFYQNEQELSVQYNAQNNSFAIPFSAGSDGEVQPILAKKGEDNTVGMLSVKTYAAQTRTIRIVPVADAAAPQTQAQVKAGLDQVFGQAATEWNVIVDEPLNLQEWSSSGDRILDVNSSSAIANYSSEMREILEAYTSERGNIPDGEGVIFLMPVEGNQTGLRGYMPRGRNVGFMMEVNQMSPEVFQKILAHELEARYASIKKSKLA
ncbi:MAG: hypothetical protein LAT68_00460 [Cyclobacteriaceae bacterium]|nr:hypothetical protein [Cyclobacteriaceae bacterium]MCH8514774.1 hypothetical protein [Cyclobacteriaceae bacterium]